MKKLTYLLAAAAVFAACNSGNKGYTVTGTVEGAADGDTVYLQTAEGRQLVKLDSAVITNGTFTFKGTQDSAVNRYITCQPSGKEGVLMDFFLENGAINIKLTSGEGDSATGTANYDAYRAYIKAEDYKDDNYAKGNEICKEEKELAEQIPGLRSQIYALLTPYADKAEEATLMDNPLKDHILAGKALIFEIEKTLELYSPEAKKEDLQAAYDAVNAKKEAASKLEKKADFQSEMSNYNNLLKYVDKFLGELRKQLRDGKFTEDGYNDLVSEYNDVISRYNSFIN